MHGDLVAGRRAEGRVDRCSGAAASFAAGVATGDGASRGQVNSRARLPSPRCRPAARAWAARRTRERRTGRRLVTAALSPTAAHARSATARSAAADVGWFVVQFAGGDGFKVGSFTKAPGAAPAPQAIPHGLGEVPKALILWTEGRVERIVQQRVRRSRFAARRREPRRPAITTLTINIPAGTVPNDVMVASVAFRPNTATVTPPAGWALVRRMDNAAGTGNSLADLRQARHRRRAGELHLDVQRVDRLGWRHPVVRRRRPDEPVRHGRRCEHGQLSSTTPPRASPRRRPTT